jgi:hypothetical protein
MKRNGSHSRESVEATGAEAIDRDLILPPNDVYRGRMGWYVDETNFPLARGQCKVGL